MSCLLVSKSVTLNDLEQRLYIAVNCVISPNFGKPAFQHITASARTELIDHKSAFDYVNVNSRSRSCHRPSVCLSSVCRLAVTFVHPKQAIEIFGNVSTPFGTLAIC